MRQLVLRLLRRKAQHGRLGVNARQHACQQAKGNLEQFVAHEDRQNGRNQGDDRAAHKQLQAAALGQGLHEGVSGAQADAGQQHDQAQLAHRQIGAVGHGPHNRTGSPNCAQDQADDQRTAGVAQVNAPPPGRGKRSLPSNNPNTIPMPNESRSISASAL